jgi:hypothetical protein
MKQMNVKMDSYCAAQSDCACVQTAATVCRFFKKTKNKKTVNKKVLL